VGKSQVPATMTGGFISQPGVFADAPENLAQLITLIHRPAISPEGELGAEFGTDEFVVDLSIVDPALLRSSTIAEDCDWFKSLALAHEGEVKAVS